MGADFLILGHDSDCGEELIGDQGSRGPSSTLRRPERGNEATETQLLLHHTSDSD